MIFVQIAFTGWCSAQDEKRCWQWLQSCCWKKGPKTDSIGDLKLHLEGELDPGETWMKHQQHDQTLRSYQAFRFLRTIWWNSVKPPKNLRIFFVFQHVFLKPIQMHGKPFPSLWCSFQIDPGTQWSKYGSHGWGENFFASEIRGFGKVGKGVISDDISFEYPR